jgi:hypothetical protein
MDAGAIVQNEARVENVRAMTEACREYGAYSDGHATPVKPKDTRPPSIASDPRRLPPSQPTAKRPGSYQPWDEKRKQYPAIEGDEPLLSRIWDSTDSLAYTYIWQLLLSF